MSAVYPRLNELGASRSAGTFAVIVIFTVISTVSIILRLVAKRLSKQKLAVEDYTILIAQLLVYGMFTCAVLEIFLGSAGHHAKDVPPSHITAFLKILVALQVFYGSSLGFIKTSICLFYIRIFFTRAFRTAAWTVIAFIVSWSVMVVLTGFLLCTPLAFNWDQTIKGGKCGNQTATYIAVGVLDLAIDCAVFILPIPMIWNLQVSRGNKVALFGIFGLGLFTMVISCLRIQTLVTVDFTDITYTADFALLWSFLEPAIGITVACGPLLRPLFNNTRFARHFTRNRATAKSGKSGGTSGSATFERLEEPAHPLINYPHNGIKTTVTAKTTPTVVFDEERAYSENKKHQAQDVKGPGGITVQREWNMRSD